MTTTTPGRMLERHLCFMFIFYFYFSTCLGASICPIAQFFVSVVDGSPPRPGRRQGSPSRPRTRQSRPFSSSPRLGRTGRLRALLKTRPARPEPVCHVQNMLDVKRNLLTHAECSFCYLSFVLGRGFDHAPVVRKRESPRDYAGVFVVTIFAFASAGAWKRSKEGSTVRSSKLLSPLSERASPLSVLCWRSEFS
ncbi:hypothetical protein HOY80DRAFT_52160 [Tuber brumale]|nr:hypothetical protein HOY80DRAFT_52160 [Tuber brumale]